MTDCIFCKIVEGKIPSRKVYEDDEMLAFHDINPALARALHDHPEEAHRLARHGRRRGRAAPGPHARRAGRLAREQGSPDGFRTIVNTGRIGRQDVYHLHIHIIGGPDPLPRMIAKE